MAQILKEIDMTELQKFALANAMVEPELIGQRNMLRLRGGVNLGLSVNY